MSTFGPGHQLWGELLELRRSGLFIRDCLKVAHEKGFRELTYGHLRAGFGSVHSGFGLPTRSSAWLRRKHENTAGLIDSLQTMIYLLMETLEELQTIKEERATASFSEAYRITLAQRETDLRDVAFDYSERVHKRATELQKLSAVEGGMLQGAPAFVVTDVETMQKAVVGLVQRWDDTMRDRLGGSDVNEAAIERFGHDNVRPAIPEAEYVRVEGDEEDFVDADGEGQ